MEKYNLIPFSELLETLMPYAGDCRIISEMLNKNGYSISVRSLQQYRSSSCVPSLQTARIILKALDANFSLEYIKLSLDLERDKQADLKLNSTKIDKHIVIYEKDFNNIANGESGFVSDIIDARLEELYSNKKNKFSLYVKDLIEADILKNVINK